MLRQNFEILLFPALYCGLFVFLGLFGIHVPILVFIAAMFSMAGAIFSKREKWWGELLYISGNILFMIHFFHAGLYGNMTSFMFGIAMCLWTIFQWTRKDKATKKYLAPSALGPLQRILLIFGLAAVMLMVSRYGIVRMLDIGILYVGVSGKLLISRKKIDGWGIWLVGDVIGLLLFSITGAWFLFGRHAICAGINIGALRNWRKELRTDRR